MLQDTCKEKICHHGPKSPTNGEDEASPNSDEGPKVHLTPEDTNIIENPQEIEIASQWPTLNTDKIPSNMTAAANDLPIIYLDTTPLTFLNE